MWDAGSNTNVLFILSFMELLGFVLLQHKRINGNSETEFNRTDVTVVAIARELWCAHAGGH